MPNGPARRQVLKAVAASSIATPVAGCLDTFETGGGSTGTTSSSESVPHQSGCEIGESIIRAFSDGDYETAASYTANRFFMDDVDDPEAVVAEDLESTDHPDQPAWIDGSITDLSCACAEPYPTAARDELEADIERDVTEILEFRFSVTTDGNDDAESVFVNAIEVDGEWYGDLSFRGSRGLCGQQDESTTDSDSASDDDTASDSESASEQPLESADWEDVEEIVLEAYTGGWVGAEPAQIDNVENPTLLLFDGREYTIEIRNGDGAYHNLQLTNTEGDVVEDSAFVEDGESLMIDIDASQQMAEYVCEPHRNTMVGEIVIDDG